MFQPVVSVGVIQVMPLNKETLCARGVTGGNPLSTPNRKKHPCNLDPVGFHELI